MDSAKWEAVLNTKILCNYFKELCRGFSPPYREASVWANRQKAESNANIIFFLTQIVRLITEERIDSETFKTEIKKFRDLSILHVEIPWYLEFFRLMPILEFIQFHESRNNEDVTEHIALNLFENLLDYKTIPSEIKKKMVFHYMKTVLECLKNSAINGGTFLQKFLNLIITNLKRLYDCEENCDVERYLDISVCEEFFNNSELDCELIKSFFHHILIGLLKSLPQTTKSIFKKQEKIKNNVKNKKIFQFFTAISKYFSLDSMMVEIKAILLDTSNEVNWNHMFCFITFVGMHYNEGWRDLKVLVNLILKESFQNLDTKLLSHAFLIARQGCYEKSNSAFPSYLQWFSSSFSIGSKKPINSKKICSWFFNFLTDISQYDLPYYLKVHINRTPWVPNDCQFILTEYIELAKTQLSDLNVSTELGICENPTDKAAAEYDVENVLRHFERTNTILNSVFQASMFCKEYYEKKFLTELLSKFEGKKSVRHKFILKLHSLGKIPNALFKVYKSLEKK